MAAWTSADVVAIAPEFAAVAAGTLDLYVARAELQLSVGAFGAQAQLAGALLTAHLLTVLPPAGVTSAPKPVGPIQSTSVGGVSVTYAVSTTAEAASRSGLGLSKYGVEFSRMTRNRALGAQVL